MRFEDRVEPFRHPYGDCILNIPINEFIQAGLPYYPLFAYRFNFEYVPEEGKRLGDSLAVMPVIKKNYWDMI